MVSNNPILRCKIGKFSVLVKEPDNINETVRSEKCSTDKSHPIENEDRVPERPNSKCIALQNNELHLIESNNNTHLSSKAGESRRNDVISSQKS